MFAGLDNPLHIALILVVILLVFGAKRLPEMGRGIGEGMRGFKQAINGEASEDSSRQSTAAEPLQLAPVEQQAAPQSAPVHTGAPAQPAGPAERTPSAPVA